MAGEKSTVTFECPDDLLRELESYQDSSTELENRSQVIRTAIRVLVSEDNLHALELPENMVKEIDAIVEESPVYESRSHYLRVCHRKMKEEGGLSGLG